MKKNKKIVKKAKPVSSPVVTAEVVPSISEGGNALQNYLFRLSKIPVLSKEEEYKLAVAYYETRDPKLAQQLIQSNLRFVVKVVAEYGRFSSKIMDLIQEGNIGLMKAVKEFNPYKGARLITYAVWWIRGYIQEYLMRQHSIVRLGTNKKQQKLFYLLQKEKQKMEEYSGQRLLSNLAKTSNSKVQDVEGMREIVLKKDLSLDQPIDKANKGNSFLDFQAEDSSLYEDISQQQMSQILKREIKKMEPSLNEKEKSIIKNRLLSDSPMTLQQIADEFGVTREAIRQSEERLMKKLRERIVPVLKKPF